MSDKRDLIVVDTETTGLNEEFHWPIEIAAINVATGEYLYFVPDLPSHALDHAEGMALKINRYFERGVFKKRLSRPDTINYYNELWDMLRGNTLAGSNPKFDASMLIRGYVETVHGDSAPPWHHRLADLSAYAAGALGLQPTELPGLNVVCDVLGVENEDAHSALGDARATAECFRRLAEKAELAKLEAVKENNHV